MKRIAIIVMLILSLVAECSALEVAGVPVAPAVVVDGHSLQLNGAGIRRKFFFKIYIGALYAARRLSTPAEVLADPGDKVIRMRFLYGRVGREKITEAFAEGFANNAPAVAGSPDARRFLALFTRDFVRGDTVDLELSAAGTVTARQNGRLLGTVRSKPLAHGILAIYFGPRPADEDLEAGMLGGNR